MLWRIKWGWHYKGLKVVAATSVKDCVQACLDNVKCFVTSWAEDKCSIQDDGAPDAEVNLKNLEARAGSITFLGRVGRLFAFRQMMDSGNSGNGAISAQMELK